MTEKNRYKFEKDLVAYCGIYCRKCDYYTNSMANAAKALLSYVEKHGELKDIVNTSKSCDYEEFLKGLKWLAKAEPCMGCRTGEGWPDCPIRKCILNKELNYCFECKEFPSCEVLKVSQAELQVKMLSDIKKKGIEKYIDDQWK